MIIENCHRSGVESGAFRVDIVHRPMVGPGHICVKPCGWLMDAGRSA